MTGVACTRAPVVACAAVGSPAAAAAAAATALLKAQKAIPANIRAR